MRYSVPLAALLIGNEVLSIVSLCAIGVILLFDFMDANERRKDR